MVSSNNILVATMLLVYTSSASATNLNNLELPMQLVGDIVGKALQAGDEVSSLLNKQRPTLLQLFGLMPKQPAGLGSMLKSRLDVASLSLVDRAINAKSRAQAVANFLAGKGQELIDEICTPERFTRGQLIPAGCKGVSLTLDITTGRCTLDLARERAECFAPMVKLTASPAVCNLKYRERCIFRVSMGCHCVFHSHPPHTRDPSAK